MHRISHSVTHLSVASSEENTAVSARQYKGERAAAGRVQPGARPSCTAQTGRPLAGSRQAGSTPMGSPEKSHTTADLLFVLPLQRAQHQEPVLPALLFQWARKMLVGHSSPLPCKRKDEVGDGGK